MHLELHCPASGIKSPIGSVLAFSNSLDMGKTTLSEWTRGNAIVKDAEAVLGRVKALGQESFTRSSLAELIEPFTSRIEYFLKSIVFPTVSRRKTLNDLIIDLASLGMGATDVARLHELRLLYNDSKHDPDKELNWRRCVDTLSGTVDALECIAGLQIATVDAPFEQDISTVIYVGFWDHYVGGETEVGLFLPSDHWLGTTPISTFHLPMSIWDTVKQLLASHPKFSFGQSALGLDTWTSFSSEGDFLNAGVWEGDVRELLTILSAFNDETLEKAVIPFLARRNDKLSIGIALVSAAVDIARGESKLSGPVLRSRVSDRAKIEYAADVETPYAQLVLDAVVALLESVTIGHRVAISGPAFRRAGTESKAKNGVPLLMDNTTFIWLLA